MIPPNATLVFEVELLAVSAPLTLGKASAEELLIAQADGAVIIDIRREEEWAETGIIDGAHTITAFTKTGRIHPEFQQKFMSVALSLDTPIVLYCRTGNRTTSLGTALVNQLGYSRLSHLSKGIKGWIDDGRKTKAYSAQ